MVGAEPVWAAWSSWRGEPKALAHVARRLAAVGAGGCSIDVVVLGDTEHFDSAEEFLERATRQAFSRFAAIRISAGPATLTIARDDLEDPFPARRGVLLEVSGHDAQAARQKLVPAISRGQFHFSREPVCSEHGRGPVKTLASIGRSRRHAVAATVLLPLTAVFIGVAAILSATLNPAWVLAGVVVVGAMCGLVLLSDRVTDLIFPAVDLADTTPGRRILKRIATLPVLPLATALAKELSK